MRKENRNNRVHTGNQSGKTGFQILDLLPVGKENAISTVDLVRLSGCGSARDLQERIALEKNCRSGNMFIYDWGIFSSG